MILLDSRNLARILQEDSQIPVILNRRSKVYIVNPTVDTGSSVERLSFGSVSFCRFLCRVASAMVCPSNLGECSLVRLLFFQNLHWVFGYGLQCLGLEELSSNILVSETCDFFYTISFADFQTLKI